MNNKTILVTMLIPIIISAEDNLLNNFIIGFWPEYDHSGVLVSLQIQSDTTKIPFKFNLTGIGQDLSLLIEDGA